jgi:hypothetical protein
VLQIKILRAMVRREPVNVFEVSADQRHTVGDIIDIIPKFVEEDLAPGGTWLSIEVWKYPVPA